jgi:hypothetical protein
MRSIKSLLGGLVLAGILALTPTAAFAHGGGRGGGGHFGGGRGHFGGARGHFGGSGHFAGFTGHSFAQHHGAHFARNENHFRHGGHFFFGNPFWYSYPYYGYNSPYYDDDYADDYAAGQSSPADLTPTIIAVQKELTQLGYYHSDVDGLIGPQTEQAIRWFQSVEKLPVTGQIDDPTLKALQIS